MNGYLRAALTIPNAIVKLSILKIFHPKKVKFGRLARISRNTELSIDNGAELIIGKRFNIRSLAKIRVRKGGKLQMGNNVSIAHYCILACHEKIEIGDDVQISPGVFIYDHDHDYEVGKGVITGYKTTPVKIGHNVWIGANTIILRGTVIGDNCIVGAGCVLKGKYEAGSVIIQKRETQIL